MRSTRRASGKSVGQFYCGRRTVACTLPQVYSAHVHTQARRPLKLLVPLSARPCAGELCSAKHKYITRTPKLLSTDEESRTTATSPSNTNVVAPVRLRGRGAAAWATQNKYVNCSPAAAWPLPGAPRLVRCGPLPLAAPAPRASRRARARAQLAAAPHAPLVAGLLKCISTHCPPAITGKKGSACRDGRVARVPRVVRAAAGSLLWRPRSGHGGGGGGGSGGGALLSAAHGVSGLARDMPCALTRRAGSALQRVHGRSGAPS